jgi:hypothetical protein
MPRAGECRSPEQIRNLIMTNSLVTDTGCWEWQKALGHKGYGLLKWNRPGLPPMTKAHRVSYTAFNGDPGDLCVLHQCDNSRCVNPGHLFLGTKAENVSDMDSKGRRFRGSVNRGVNNRMSKLSEDQVLEIRGLAAGGLTQADVGSVFGVSRECVSKVVNGSRWGHIKG